MDDCHGSVRHPVWRALSGDHAMIRTDIRATPMIAWSTPSPSSPAPAAPRRAASGLDRSVRPSKMAVRAADVSISMDENENQPSQKSHTQNF
jgi:hypothetical protein